MGVLREWGLHGYVAPPLPGMVFAFSTLGFWLRRGGAVVAPGGLLVEWVRVALSHAALCLYVLGRVGFACNALRSALCVGFAFPRCAGSGEGFDNACNDVKHGAIP